MSDSPPPSSVAELQAIVLREAVSLTDFSGHIHALLERSPSAIFAKRREDWRYIYANAAFEEFTSRLRDEMLGRTDEELFAVVSASKLRYDDAEIAETGEPTRREIVIRLNDSEERTFSVVKFPLRDRAGHIFAVCAILTDLTEQKRAVGALQDSEARWRTLFENTHQHISTIDSAGTILTVNRGLLGLSPSELVGMRCIDLVVGSGRDTLKKAISGVFVAPEVFVTEQEMRAPNGTSTWFEITLGPILRHGRVAEAILIASDITERRLIEERLRHSQKMEAVGRLAGGVAHDFNNLLTVISGHLQLHLRDITRGTASSENVQAALDAAYRASELTKQLLTFSRKSVVKPVLVDLNEIVREHERMLRRLIGERIELVVECWPDRCSVRADPGQVHQALMNLAVNARDAMPEGGRLSIRTSILTSAEVPPRPEGSEAKRYVAVAVEDNGVGMSPEVLERIFEPFFTTKEVGKGTGLGLATVHGIVLTVGGRIEIKSAIGKGTVLVMYLPLADGVRESIRAATKEVEARPVTETVMVVEDDPSVRALVRQILAREGYRVIEAKNGEEALSVMLGLDRIDVLVSDVVMPGLGARTLSERVAARFPNIKVIFSSGYNEDESITRLGERGETGSAAFIPKPYAPTELLAKIRELLDGR